MKFPNNRRKHPRNGARAGFTLAEVMAALMFLAIVIPTAVEVLHVASLAGEVAARKSAAARVATTVLNQSLVTTNWSSGQAGGVVTEGAIDYHWRLQTQTWPADAMQQVTAEVTYSAQGKQYSVSLSTLANPLTGTAGATGMNP